MLEEEYIRLWRENQQLKNELKEKTEAIDECNKDYWSVVREVVDLKKENAELAKAKTNFNAIYGYATWKQYLDANKKIDDLISRVEKLEQKKAAPKKTGKNAKTEVVDDIKVYRKSVDTCHECAFFVCPGGNCHTCGAFAGNGCACNHTAYGEICTHFKPKEDTK